jgi:hypothetical protein
VLSRHRSLLPISRISVRQWFADSISYLPLLQVNIEVSVRSYCKEKSLHHTGQMLHSRHFAAKPLMGKELKAF